MLTKATSLCWLPWLLLGYMVQKRTHSTFLRPLASQGDTSLQVFSQWLRGDLCVYLKVGQDESLGTCGEWQTVSDPIYIVSQNRDIAPFQQAGRLTGNPALLEPDNEQTPSPMYWACLRMWDLILRKHWLYWEETWGRRKESMGALSCTTWGQGKGVLLELVGFLGK